MVIERINISTWSIVWPASATQGHKGVKGEKQLLGIIVIFGAAKSIGDIRTKLTAQDVLKNLFKITFQSF